MSEPLTFLQRVALAAASEPFPAAPRASAGMLTLGRLVRRRRVRLARFPATGVEAVEPLENAALAEASADRAPGVPGPASATGRPEARPSTQRREAAAKSPQSENPAEVSLPAREQVEPAVPVVPASAPLATDTTQTSAPGLAAAQVATAAASVRAAAAPASIAALAAPAVLRRRLQRDLDESAQDDEEEKEPEPPQVARAASEAAANGSFNDELEQEEEKEPSVQRALLAGASSPAFHPAAPASPGVPAPVQAPGAWTERQPLAPQLDAFARTPPSSEGPGAPLEPAAAAQMESSAPGARVEPPAQRGELSVPPALAAAPVAAVEPVVHIGSIEIVIEAPAPEPRSAGPARAPAADLASRFYLRGL